MLQQCPDEILQLSTLKYAAVGVSIAETGHISLLKTTVMGTSTWAGTTAPGTAEALTHPWLQRKGAAADQLSGCLMSLPGAGDSSLTGGSCPLVAGPSCQVKELQEEVSCLCSSQEEEQEVTGSSQRCCKAKDHPSPVLQRRENLETTLTGAVDGHSHRREGWKPLVSSNTQGLLFHPQFCYYRVGTVP